MFKVDIYYTVAECIMHLYCWMHRTSISSSSACCVVCECSVTAKPEHLLYSLNQNTYENDDLYIHYITNDEWLLNKKMVN